MIGASPAAAELSAEELIEADAFSALQLARCRPRRRAATIWSADYSTNCEDGPSGFEATWVVTRAP